MLKGVSRRVIVVRQPDRRFFEQAIFIVREDVAEEGGFTAQQVVEQARQVAEEYAHRGGESWWRAGVAPWRLRLRAVGYVALGALLATALWCASLLV